MPVDTSKLDIVSPEIAEELEKYGLQHTTEDHHAFLDRRKDELFWWSDSELDVWLFQTGYAIYLPSRRACEIELERMGHGWSISYRGNNDQYVCIACPIVEVSDPAANTLYGDADTPADAVGKALVEALRRANA